MESYYEYQKRNYKCPHYDTSNRCKWFGNSCKQIENCDHYGKTYGNIANTRRKVYWEMDEKLDSLSLEQLKSILKIIGE